ncbi:MAG: TetR family transcriptional regulator [Actinomycetota bacterium]|nr:TetR family transcriptional regulator [Actinomycetota bacterium]
MISLADAPRPDGLRERKKARTRAAIQHEALRLFRLQGYDSTTTEQIAEAAEVAPSTLFRYFSSKEDLVLSDDYDPVIVDAARAQPPDVGPVAAIREALRTVFRALGPEEISDMYERVGLALSVPDLRAAMLDQLAQTMHRIAEFIAERSDRPPDDFDAATLAGAIVGVLIAAELHWVAHPDTDLISLIDSALEHLESGLRP